MSDAPNRNEKRLADVNVSNIGLFLTVMFLVVVIYIVLDAIT